MWEAYIDDGVVSTPGNDNVSPTSGRGAARSALASQAVVQAGSLITTVFLARILTRSEFGTIALVNSIVGLAGLFAASGFDGALIRSKDRVRERASSYFWATTTAGGVCTVIVAVLAGPLTAAAGVPAARRFLTVASLILLLSVVTSIPIALLRRRLQFGRVNLAQTTGAIVYFAAQLVLAVSGAGVWSVIVGMLIGQVVTLVIAVIAARWLPALTVDVSLIRQDLGFAGGFSATQLLIYFIRNVDYWLVARILGASALGSYYIAYVIPNIIRQRMSWAAQSVLYTWFVRHREDDEGFRRLWITSWSAQVGIGLPALTGLAVCSSQIIQVFFGPQWSSAATPLAILAFTAAIDLHMAMVSIALTSRGLIGLMVRAFGARAALTGMSIAAALLIHPSLTSAAIGLASGALGSTFVQEKLVRPRLKVGLLDIRKLLVHYGTCSAIMAAATWVIGEVIPGPAWAQLLIMVVFGAATYGLVGWMLFRSTFRSLLSEVIRLTKGR